MKTECSQVQRQLSAYLDGALDANAHAAVAAHLDRCSACRQKWVELEGLVRAIGAVPQTRAPKDFGKRLYERIEDESFLQRMLRKLFVPLRIKLPLELATAAVAVLVIFFVVQQPQMGEKAADMTLHVSEDDEAHPVAAAPPALPLEPKKGVTSTPGTALRPALGGDTGAPAERAGAPEKIAPKKHKTTVRPSSAAPGSEMQGEFRKETLSRSSVHGTDSGPITLTLFIRGAAKNETAAGSFSPAPGKAAAPTIARLKEAQRVDRRSAGEGIQTADAEMKEAAPLSSNVLTASPSIPPAEAEVRTLAAELGATVQREERSEETGVPVILQIDIPTARYALFCTRLQSIGRFDNPPPDMDAHQSPTVKMRLKLSTL